VREKEIVVCSLLVLCTKSAGAALANRPLRERRVGNEDTLTMVFIARIFRAHSMYSLRECPTLSAFFQQGQ
jgi:hypothetical protein